jgi:hypothetical protein
LKDLKCVAETSSLHSVMNLSAGRLTVGSSTNEIGNFSPNSVCYALLDRIHLHLTGQMLVSTVCYIFTSMN